MAWLPLVLGVLDLCGSASCVLRVDSPEPVLRALQDLPTGRIESITAGADHLTVRACPAPSDCRDVELRAATPDCPGLTAGALCLVVPGGAPTEWITPWTERLSQIPADRLWRPLPGDHVGPNPSPDAPPAAPPPAPDKATTCEAVVLAALLALLLPWALGAWLGLRLAGRWPPVSSTAVRGGLLLAPPLGAWAIASIRAVPLDAWDLVLPAASLGLGLRWGAGRPRQALRSALRGIALLIGLLALAEAAYRLALPSPVDRPSEQAAGTPTSGSPESPTSALPPGPVPVPPPRALGGPFPLAVLHLRPGAPGDLTAGVLEMMNRRDHRLWHLDMPFAPGAEDRAWETALRWIEAERVVGFVLHQGPEPPEVSGDLEAVQVLETAGPPPATGDPGPRPAPSLLRSAAGHSRLAAHLRALLSPPTGGHSREAPRSPAALVLAIARQALREGIPMAVISPPRPDSGAGSREASPPPGDKTLRMRLEPEGIPFLQAPVSTNSEEAANRLLEALEPFRSRAQKLAEDRLRAQQPRR